MDNFAVWLDRFFDDDEQRAQQATSSLRFRQFATTSAKGATEFKTRISARLYLPNLSRRLSLVFRGDDTLDAVGDNGEPHVADGIDESLATPAVALRYQKNIKKWKTSFSVGVRPRGGNVYMGPKISTTFSLSQTWKGQFVQRLRWYSKTGINSDSRLDLDHQLGDSKLLRQQFLVQWRESDDSLQGVRSTITTSYMDRVSQSAAFRVDLAHVIQKGHQESILSLRWRKTVIDDWLFVELSPRIAFQARNNWSANPGIQASVEIIFNQQ